MTPCAFVGIKNAAKSFRNLQVLKDINLTVDHGQIVAMIRPSGSGKSTAARVIHELQPLPSGEISLERVQINRKLPPRQ